MAFHSEMPLQPPGLFVVLVVGGVLELELELVGGVVRVVVVVVVGGGPLVHVGSPACAGTLTAFHAALVALNRLQVASRALAERSVQSR